MRHLLVSLITCTSLAFGRAAMSRAQDVDPAVQGKRGFIRCASCHVVGTSGGGRIGPNLAGVIGRKAGSLTGYPYSPAMAKQDFVWTEATLDAWLTQPSAVVPGTSMAFAGLPKASDRAAIIAYLKKPTL